MKKTFSFVISVALLAFLGPILTANALENHHSVEIDFAQYFNVGIEDTSSSGGAAYYLQNEVIDFKSTFQLSNNAIDLTGNVAYYPWKVNGKTLNRFGFGTTLHLEHYYQTFFETDALLNFCYNLETPKKFSLWFDIGGIYDNSVIYGMNGSMSQFSLALRLKLMKEFPHGIALYFSFASHDDFRYPIFISPFYTLGLTFDVFQNNKLGIESMVRARDQFTTSPCVDYVYLKAYWRYTF